MRSNEEVVLAATIPHVRLGGAGVYSLLDYVLNQSIDESYFTGLNRLVFQVAVAANTLQVGLDDEVVRAMASERGAQGADVTRIILIVRDLELVDVPLEKLRVVLPAFREEVHTNRMGESLAEAAVVLTEGKDVDGKPLQGYRDARQLLVSRFADLERRETGVLPQQEIREHADDIMAEYERTKLVTEPGVLSGFREIDQLTNGQQKGELYIIAGFTGEGKALAVDTPIVTPGGWSTMADLKVGDAVFGADGLPTRVVFKSPVRTDRRCYRITFSDGSTIVCDADHQWTVREWAVAHPESRPSKTLTTTVIAGSYRKYGRSNYSIETCAPLDLPEDTSLPIDPYVLGAWLGDGNSADGLMTVAEPEIVAEFAARGQPLHKLPSDTHRYGTNGLQAKLRALGVLRNKHIPARYLRSSVSQRLALLQGLMDTDGYVSTRGQCEFCSTRKELADGALELALSLGIKAVMSPSPVRLYGKDCGTRYRLRFRTALPVFLMRRKAARIEGTLCQHAAKVMRRRYIRKVEAVPSVPVQCISVDNETHLYLAGSQMVPTHNTQFMLNNAYHAAIDQGKDVAFISLEMPMAQVRRRLISRHTNHRRFGIPGGLEYNKIKKGALDRQEEAIFRDVVVDWRDNTAYGKLHVLQMDKTSTVKTVSEKLMYLRSKGPIDLVVLDYAALLSSSRRRQSDREEITDVVEGLKDLALNFNQGESLAILTGTQTSRKARDEAEQLRRYGLSFASDTSAIEKNADLLMWILRLSDMRVNKEVLCGISKYRDGDVGSEFRLMEHYESSLLADLAPLTGGVQP